MCFCIFVNSGEVAFDFWRCYWVSDSLRCVRQAQIGQEFVLGSEIRVSGSLFSEEALIFLLDKLGFFVDLGFINRDINPFWLFRGRCWLADAFGLVDYCFFDSVVVV